MEHQNHPLYETDRNHIDRMLAKNSPEDTDLVDLARLYKRYGGFPGAYELQEDMDKTLILWGITKEILEVRAREIWQSGYRPGGKVITDVGSGFDTSDKDLK